MNILWETYDRLIKDLIPVYERLDYGNYVMDERLTGIVGQRGVGKTTYLLHYLKTNFPEGRQALYVSADHAWFTQNSLLDLVDRFYKDYDGKFLCIDEIHRYPNWNQELKNIYDSYPGLRLLFSGSSSIDLVKGHYDLSRRALLYPMYGFSFREYLEKNLQIRLAKYEFEELIADHLVIESKLNVDKLLGHFKQYLKTGYYPFSEKFTSDQRFYKSLQSIIDKIIYQDIASFYKLNTDSLLSVRKLLFYLATTNPGEVNVNRLSSSLGRDNKTVGQYLQILYETGLIRKLNTGQPGHALVRKPKKIYLENANLLYCLANQLGMAVEVGTVREIFAIGSLQQVGKAVFYSRQGDFICEGVTFEVGGKSKSKRQIKGVDDGLLLKDDILTGDKHALPLWLLGFLR